MKTLAILSLVAISVSAKSSSGSSNAAPAAATTAAPVASSVTNSCSTFLGTLDTDSSLQSCLSAINSATKSITPNASSSDISNALGSICSSSTTQACSETIFRTQLTNFLADCKDELTGSNPNKQAQDTYDALYAVAPYLESVCSKDSGNYCVSTIAKQAVSGTSLLDLAKNFIATVVQLPLSKRGDSPFSSSGTYLVPNATTFQAASLPYQFLNANTPQATLCSACSQAILKPYLSFESSIANALTVNASPLLGSQKGLWDALQNQCGSQFTSGVVANAGAAPPANNVTIGGSLGAATSVKVSAGGVIAALVGAFIAL